MRVYLDNAATTKLSASMKKYLISVLDIYGNPSSLHSAGDAAKQIVSKARQSVAKFINADAKDIYFTSGGSASNTLAVRGYYLKNACPVFYSPIIHKSILKCVESYPDRQPLKANSEGIIDICDLKERLDACNNKPLVIIDHANSEIGSIQNISDLIKTVHLYGGIIYLDCTGSIPQIPIDAALSDADMIGFSSHKLGGLKGCGVLYKKRTIELEPLVYGTQEGGLSSGTENVLGIASLGKTIEHYNYASVSPANRDYVYNYIMKNIPACYLVGASVNSGNRLPHNLNICFKGVEGESLMILLDMNGIQVSTGSACNSQDMTPSSALSAIGMNEEDIHSCIRLSFSGAESINELDYVNEKLKQCVEKLRSFNNE